MYFVISTTEFTFLNILFVSTKHSYIFLLANIYIIKKQNLVSGPIERWRIEIGEVAQAQKLHKLTGGRWAAFPSVCEEKRIPCAPTTEEPPTDKNI